MTLIIRNDLFAFVAGFVLAWWFFTPRRQPRPDNVKSQMPDADAERIDLTPILPHLPAKEEKSA